MQVYLFFKHFSQLITIELKIVSRTS